MLYCIWWSRGLYRNSVLSRCRNLAARLIDAPALSILRDSLFKIIMKASLRNTTHFKANTLLYDTVIVSCILKRYLRVVLQAYASAWQLLFLFLPSPIKVKTTSHFPKYLFKLYKCIYEHFEKPNYVLFQKYRCTPLFLHLSQWQLANETESLIQLHYAQIKRNPE